MRIAIVLEQLDLYRGGQERSTLEIAELLAARGLEVSIITGRAENLPASLRARIVDLGVRVRSRAAHFLEFTHRAERYLREEAFDVIHAVTPIPSANVYQPRGGLIQETVERSIARRTGVTRLFRKIVGPNTRQRLVRRAERNLAQRSTCRFLAVSDYVKAQCRRHLGLSDARVRTIFNGVDLARLPETGDPKRREHLRTILHIRPEQVVGVFAAANFRLKGLDTLLDAVVLLKDRYPQEFSRLRFLISGPDKVRPFFHRVRRTGLDTAVFFLGPTQDMGILYHMADFLVHPTWYDPCSRVVLEALACGVPAISTACNGASELITRANAGFVLDDPGDVPGLASHCRRLLDPDLRATLSRNARTIRGQIGMDLHVTQLIEFYQTLKQG